ncbi:SH3 domain-containing protein [Chryseobacterium sp.]|uniref:SH3 domain-containing protein n=1 Tax=Chryseobacterium sp. TaxID=1871047 RepID=UPI003341CC69
MKTKKIFLFAAALSIQLSFAQFAKVVDKDGYVNVRKNADAKSNIVGKINSGEILYIFSEDANESWLNIDYNTEKEKPLTGYVHRSRVKFIESYDEIPSTEKNANKGVFMSGNIKVNIVSGTFDYSQHKKDFSSAKHGDNQQLEKYKGQEIWGTDGLIPKTYYESITVQIGNKTIEIPQKEIENLFNADTAATHCYFDVNNDTLYIMMNNSEGAGAYVALFIVEKGKYKGRVLALPF